MNTETTKVEILPGINIDAPKTELKSKEKKGDKYILINPKKPFVKAVDGELDDIKPESLDENKVGKIIGNLINNLPTDLRDTVDLEDTKNAVLISIEDLDKKIYQELRHGKNSVFSNIIELTKVFYEKEKEKLPYLLDKEKFMTLFTMLMDDRKYLIKELDSIRSLYSKYLDENGKAIKGLREDSVRMTTIKLDIYTRFMVFINRMKKVFDIPLKHVGDFYTTMVYNYYVDHFDEAPDDVKELIKTQTEIQRNTKDVIKNIFNKEKQDGE